MDWSKGISLHRLYGHSIFIIEAEKARKEEQWRKRICEELGCFGGVFIESVSPTTTGELRMFRRA